MCEQCNTAKEARPDIYPSHLPKNALTDPVGVLSQLLGEVQQLHQLVANTRGLIVAQAEHIELLENRVRNLEARMGE